MDRYSDEKFKEIVSHSNSYTELMQKLGYKAYSGDSKALLNKKIEKMGIDISHFYCKKHPNISRADEEIFIANSPINGRTMRSRYAKLYPPNKCSICGQTNYWNDKPLTLILDHINGKNNDHRLTNLRWVCPNCNMQLPTTNRRKRLKGLDYQRCVDCGEKLSDKRSLRCANCERKRRKLEIQDSKPITREELKNLIRIFPFVEIGKQFNVSDNAIRKWCKLFSLPFKKEEIKKYTDKEWELL